MNETLLTQLENKLPFDQYSRQKIVSYLIDNGIRNKNQKLNLIDLGGHKGQTPNFHPQDKITVLDIYDESYENYIKGDATNLEFNDSVYDVACSFDVFEHIPREKRQAFVDEALRVSEYGVFIAMPIDTETRVSAAEKLLNRFHKIIFSDDHPWLKEHIDYQIPTHNEIKRLVRNAGAKEVHLLSNQLGDWQLMQMLIFAAAQNPEMTDSVNQLNAWYNKNTIDLDGALDIGYRGVYFISKNENKVKNVTNAIERLKENNQKNAQYVTVNQKTFDRIADTLAHMSAGYNDLYNRYMENSRSKKVILEENTALKASLEGFKHQNETLTNDMNNIYASVSWKVTKPIRAANSRMRKSKKR